MSVTIDIDIEDEIESYDVVKLVKYFCDKGRVGENRIFDLEELNQMIEIIENSGLILKREVNLNYKMKMELIDEVIDDFTLEELTNRLKK